MYINGKWAIEDGELEIVNPATKKVVQSIKETSGEDVDIALHHSEKAFRVWRETNKDERYKVLMQIAEKLVENREKFAQVITSENGKTIGESTREINIAISYFKWYAEEAKRVYGEIVPSQSFESLSNVIRQPIGPSLAITPWNYPLSMVARKLAPALAAGCSMIIKPASKTPLSAIELFKCIDQTDLPKGVAQLVVGSPKTVGNKLIESPIIKKISFTGSTQAGLNIIKQSLTSVKKFSMELGGHAPFIVFDNCDLDKAATDLLQNKFANCGQACISTNRVFVHKDVYAEFATLLKSKVSAIQVGDGSKEGTDMGPLVDEASLNYVDSQVKDAVQKSATLIHGGKKIEQLDGYFYEPTILGDVNEDMDIYYEETFGPLLPLTKFEDMDDLLSKANDSEYALAAYVYTNNIEQYKKLATHLEYGMIGFNSIGFIDISSPFGGLKNSGFGKEGGKYGLNEYLIEKLVSI